MRKCIKMIFIIMTLVMIFGSCQAPLAIRDSNSPSRSVSYALWDPTTPYTSGCIVSWKNYSWKASWWTKGEEPGTTGQWGVWSSQGIITEDTLPPSVPGNPVASEITQTKATITWAASIDNIGVTGYWISFNGGASVLVPSTVYVVSGLRSATQYQVRVIAVDGAGLLSQGSFCLFTTLPGVDTDVVTTGTIDFHLHLGISAAQDKLILDGDNYTDLIMSNFVAGVMCGHLIKTYYPGMQFNKDYLYGSIMGQLLQENLGTEMYKAESDLIAPDPTQQSVMGAGQGGPYQINNYAADMVNGSYTPQGYSLINFVTVQKKIGFTMADAETQHSKITPPSFNNKYYSPMLTAYFHYMDFVALIVTGKGTGGWVTPWQPFYDNALANFKNLPNNFLDVILNVSYNQGSYGGLVSRYSQLGANANSSDIAFVRSYSSVWGKGWYEQYPYQVMYYLDQMYGNPIPTTSATNMFTPNTHIAFSMTQLADVFSKVYQTMAYVNASGQYNFISVEQSRSAFTAGLSQVGVLLSATLDLSNAVDRAKIFSVLENAISSLETSLGVKFNTTTSSQL